MGWADRFGEGDGDGEVSLRELHRYVSKYVSAGPKRTGPTSRCRCSCPLTSLTPMTSGSSAP